MMNRLEGDFALLSEGDADKNFLHQLMAYWHPAIAFCSPFPNKLFYSITQIGNMLSALRGDREGFSRLKGVLIFADSCNNPNATFGMVADQIRSAEHYAVPDGIGLVAPAQQGHPGVAVLTIPASDRPGGLETLYADELAARLPDVGSCVETFLTDQALSVSQWNAEKQGKARYGAFVAGTHQDDPSRSASFAFRTPPVVNIQSPIFEPLAQAVGEALKGME